MLSNAKSPSEGICKMKKKYEVLVSYSAEHGRDVRCRCDIDKQRGFVRLPDGNVRHTDFKSNNSRLFMVVYSGPERDATRFAEMLKLGYDGLGVPRSILTQVEGA